MNLPRPVTIVVPIWNGLAHLQNLVVDLQATLRGVPVETVEVVFVDDASTDGAREFCRQFVGKQGKRKAGSRYRLLCHEENLGFTAAVNRGILAAGRGRDVVLLNTDIRLGTMVEGQVAYHEDWLGGLQAVALRSPRVGVVAPRLRDLAGGLNTTHSYIDSDHVGWPLPCLRRDRGQYLETEPVETVTFACVYLTRACINAVGLLEETMRVYCSDSFFCICAGALGWAVMRAGEVTLTHAVGGSLADPRFNYSDHMVRDTAAFKACLPVVRPVRFPVNVSGVMGFPTGYGKLTWNILRSLATVGCSVSGIPLEVPEKPSPVNPALFQDVVKYHPYPGAPTICATTPDAMRNWGTGPRIGLTMLETDGIPAQWADCCNELDEVWLPSEFNARTFRAGGVTRPIRVLPPPVDTDLYHPRIEPFRLRHARDFNVLAVFEWGERKWPYQLLETVLRTFDGHHDVTFHVRTWQGNPDLGRGLYGTAQKMGSTVPVHWIRQTIAEPEMGALYRAADVVVCIGAEGIGMPALEALACGTPVIGFGGGAGGEFVGTDRGLVAVPSDIVPAVAKCPYYHGFNWGVPDWTHVSRLLLESYYQRESCRERAAVAGGYVRAEYRLDRVGQRYVEALSNPA